MSTLHKTLLKSTKWTNHLRSSDALGILCYTLSVTSMEIPAQLQKAAVSASAYTVAWPDQPFIYCIKEQFWYLRLFAENTVTGAYWYPWTGHKLNKPLPCICLRRSLVWYAFLQPLANHCAAVQSESYYLSLHYGVNCATFHVLHKRSMAISGASHWWVLNHPYKADNKQID